MSIVERALDKQRGGGGKSEDSRRPPRADARRGGEPSKTPVAPPEPRIKATPLELDRQLCRERRLLLGGDEEKDAAAVAAYRMLRTRLLHRARAHKWTTIAVTSAGPNDGKTLTALNLACSMAREKSRDIVLLDLDMRNPSVCKTLGVEPQRELRDYLDQDQGVDHLFFSIGSDNLLIAGGITPTENASELLASPRFDQLIAELKQGTVNPVVLIDLPPVLVTDDALVVAPKIDAILVVASEKLTSRADLTKALELLSEFPIAGVVLNRASETTRGYDYGGYGGKGPADP